MVYIVHTHSKTGAYLGIAIDWAFQSREAAQWWVDHKADQELGWQYKINAMPLYDLATVKQF